MRTHRRESRELWGFKHFPTALRACALRIDPQERFDPVTSTFVVGDPTGPDGQYVEVLMDLNAASLAEQAEVNLDDLELVLTFRNRESRLLLPLWRIGASGHPRKWGGRIPADRVSPRRYQLTLQLSLAHQPRIKTANGSWGKLGERGVSSQAARGPSPTPTGQACSTSIGHPSRTKAGIAMPFGGSSS